MAKTIFSGLEDSGKSLMLATVAANLVWRNAKWAKQSEIARPIVSNLEFSPEFRDYAKGLGIEIRYWRDVAELVDLRDCDLIMDEVATYFDSRTFKDLPLDVRMWLAQASKLGCDIYGSAQDFAQVDIAFRRLTTELWHVTKWAGSRRPAISRPPVTRIWGICTMRQLDPVAYDEETKKFAGEGLPRIFFITKAMCSIFDTTKRIPKSSPPPFKHVERRCVDENCKFERHKIINGVHYIVSHV